MEMPPFDENDPQFQEAMKNFAKLDEFIAGTEFDKKLDEFIEKQLASGVQVDELLNSAMKNMKPMNAKNPDDPFKDGEKVEFDPSKLQIDPELFSSFKEMMNERSENPEMADAFKEMLKMQPESLKEMAKGPAGFKFQEETTVIDIDEEDQEDIEALKGTKASDNH